MLRTLQIGLGMLTIALAILNEAIVLIWWRPDNASPFLHFILLEIPMLTAVLGSLLAIRIALSGRYELNLALIAATLLVMAGAAIVFWGDPLATVVALSLLLTTIASGLAMNRAWRVESIGK